LGYFVIAVVLDRRAGSYARPFYAAGVVIPLIALVATLLQNRGLAVALTVNLIVWGSSYMLDRLRAVPEMTRLFDGLNGVLSFKRFGAREGLFLLVAGTTQIWVAVVASLYRSIGISEVLINLLGCALVYPLVSEYVFVREDGERTVANGLGWLSAFAAAAVVVGSAATGATLPVTLVAALIALGFVLTMLVGWRKHSGQFVAVNLFYGALALEFVLQEYVPTWSERALVWSGLFLAITAVSVTRAKRASREGELWWRPIEMLSVPGSLLVMIVAMAVSREAGQSALALGLSGLTVLIHAWQLADRRWGYLGVGLLLTSYYVEIIGRGITEPQVFSMPGGLVLLVLAVAEHRRGLNRDLKLTMETRGFGVVLGGGVVPVDF
jgi:hypothetical protein